MGGTVPDGEATVLIVDDNADHCELVRVVGRRIAPGVTWRAVGDGQQALDYLSGQPPYDDRGQYPYPSLVLLDLMMPRMDGFGVLSRLQGPRWEKRVPIVVLTSSLNPVDEARANALGADAFYTKPAGFDGLAGLISDLVARWVN